MLKVNLVEKISYPAIDQPVYSIAGATPHIIPVTHPPPVATPPTKPLYLKVISTASSPPRFEQIA